MGELDEEECYAAFHAYVAELDHYPNAHQFGLFLMNLYGVVGRNGGPLSEQTIEPVLPGLRQRYQQDLGVNFADLELEGPEATAFGETLEGASAAPDPLGTQDEQHTPIPPSVPAEQCEPSQNGEPTPRRPAPNDAVQPTAVDRYYLGYESFFHTHGRDPNREELAAHLADLGITNPHGQPVKANAVGRYQLEFRAYAVWTEMHDATGTEPDMAALLQEVDGRGIKGLHNKPLTREWMAERIADFRRRRRAITPAVVDWSSAVG
ncbi:hypothetical protein [Streptomyces sp. NPDC002853]